MSENKTSKDFEQAAEEKQPIVHSKEELDGRVADMACKIAALKVRYPIMYEI